MEIYQKNTESVFSEFATSPDGLSSQEVAKRIEKHGYNELRQAERTPLWKLFVEAWKDPMMIILALVVVVKLFIGEFIESLVIIAVLVTNSLISVIQTRKAEGSLEALRQISAPVAKVKRDGKVLEVPARELVPGDIVTLEAGDFVPADGRIVECNSLKIDEGLLTGESVPVEKLKDTLEGSLALGDRRNMVYSGAVAVHGRGDYIVTGTAKEAEIGKIATLIETADDRQTPLQRKLEHFSKKLGLVIMAICALIFATQLIRAFTDAGGGAIEWGPVILSAFMFAVAVAVAAIPEALSSVVTIVLAVGTKTMAKRNAIIRKLPAVEALGSTSVICTDKTGTLTQNKMTVMEHFLPNDGKLEDSLLLKSMALCNDARLNEDGSQIGDPTETALLVYCDKVGTPHQSLRAELARIAELPFDSERKLMSTLNNVTVPDEPGKKYMFTKGAPDVMFSRCSFVMVDGKEVPLTAELLKSFEDANDAFGGKALRVLAYGVKKMSGETISLDDENELILVGLTAMIDPPREEVYASIAQAKSAHIRTVMITGDHKNTATAIARDIGILQEGDIAVTGMELDAMTEDELSEKLPHISVYARVSPENKITIVKAWQKRGQITAMTGDGVNDAPSLKQADIGVAMGSGTEVSKDASAMILTDDNFVTIVSAVSVGRTIFDNIKKVVGYLFSGNLAGIIAILFAFAVGWDSPLTALQILFINLVNDSIPAIALGLEKSEPSVMDRPPRDMNEGIFGGGLFASVMIRGTLIGIATILAQFIGLQLFPAFPAVGGAMAFTTLILARTLQTFSSRSNSETLVKLGLFSNKYVLLAVGVCLALYVLTILPGVREVFSISDYFGLNAWGIAAGLALGTILIMEIVKWVRHRGSNKT
ncbi:MAG: cation-translocating P-type ATPase [Oscillospiraceae bacterium]|nr:cation-translocating P-type ATPase [Oscillospiraceae bacterium]